MTLFKEHEFLLAQNCLFREPVVENIKHSQGLVGVLYEFNEFQNFKAQMEGESVRVPQELYDLGKVKAEERRQQGARCVNMPNLSLTNVNFDGAGTPEFVYARSDYYSNLGTHGSLDREIFGGLRVRDIYGGFDQMVLTEGFNRSRYSKTVGTSTLILTRDQKALFTRRSKNVAIEPGNVHVTIAEGMTEKDIDDKGRINPIKTFLRGVREELENPREESIKPTDFFVSVRALSLGLSRKYLQPEFSILAETTQTADEVIGFAASSRGRWERQEIFAVEFELDAISDLLSNNTLSPHAYLTLISTLRHKGLIQ